MPDDDYMAGFLARVKAWMDEAGIDGDPVSLTAHNFEWGSTEDGFHDELTVELNYRAGDREQCKYLGAAEQESLWKNIVR